MSILSLQSIIQKYGAKYGIDPKAAIKDPSKAAIKDPSKAAVKDSSKDAGKKSTNASAAAASAKDSVQPHAGTVKIPPADSVKLSPAAKDFLASHTGSLGKFEMPNVLDAFLGAKNGTDQGGNGNDTGKSLLDYLSGSGNANQGNGGSGAGATGYGNPFAIGKGPSKSLLDFL